MGQKRVTVNHSFVVDEEVTAEQIGHLIGTMTVQVEEAVVGYDDEMSMNELTVDTSHIEVAHTVENVDVDQPPAYDPDAPSLTVTVTRSAGDDRAVLMLVDTNFEPDGSDKGPGLRILVNDDEAFVGKAYDLGADHQAESQELTVRMEDIPYKGTYHGITRIECYTCNYVSTEVTEMELWNDYGVVCMRCDTKVGKTEFTMSDGTVTIVTTDAAGETTHEKTGGRVIGLSCQPCTNGCEVVEPYGWTVEVGCLVHDPDAQIRALKSTHEKKEVPPHG